MNKWQPLRRFFLLLLFIVIAAGIVPAFHSDKVGKSIRGVTGMKKDCPEASDETDLSGGIFLHHFLKYTE